MTEGELGREIMKAATECGARLFRNNTGLGWSGNAQFHEVDGVKVVIIRNARPLHAGLCVGSPDYIGWTKDGRFLAIEVKLKGKPTKEQKNFIFQVQSMGGVGIIAYSVQDVVSVLKSL
jgi:hypothetical protein